MRSFQSAITYLDDFTGLMTLAILQLRQTKAENMHRIVRIISFIRAKQIIIIRNIWREKNFVKAKGKIS